MRHRQRAVRQHPVEERRRAFHGVLVDRIHQARRQRLLAPHRIAGEDHPEGPAPSDEAREPLGAAVSRDDAELHFREPELRLRPGNPQVTGEREFKPAAERETADRGDDRLPRPLDGAHDFLAPPGDLERRLRCQIPEFGDVRPGDEGPVARAGEHDPEYLGVIARVLEGVREGLERLPVQGVEGLGPVHRDEREAPPLGGLPALDREVGMSGHAAAPLPAPFPAASTIMAIPWPPPMQAVARP